MTTLSVPMTEKQTKRKEQEEAVDLHGSEHFSLCSF